MATLEPLNDRLVVEAIEDPETTEGGVVLPEQAKEKPQRGKVLALGPEAGVPVGKGTDDWLPNPLMVGDTILYSKYGGAEITVEAKDYIVLRVNDVLARIEVADPATSA